jgi:hypothetical protein
VLAGKQLPRTSSVGVLEATYSWPGWALALWLPPGRWLGCGFYLKISPDSTKKYRAEQPLFLVFYHIKKQQLPKLGLQFAICAHVVPGFNTAQTAHHQNEMNALFTAARARATPLSTAMARRAYSAPAGAKQLRPAWAESHHSAAHLHGESPPPLPQYTHHDTLI